MDDRDVGKHWDANAEAWTALSRRGYDYWRDEVNTPAFIALLPPVSGLRGIDIGCGEGTNTRTVARLGAQMTGVDISPTFIEFAAEEEARNPLGVRYLEAAGQNLPFEADTFDFGTAFMSLMDMADFEAALREACRVIRPGGFLQFSILHPCFFTSERTLVTDADGHPNAVQVGKYFETVEFVEEWTFGAAPAEELARWRKFQVPYFGRTLSTYLNAIVDAGFQIERVNEPRPTEAQVQTNPRLLQMYVTACLLHVRCRKPTAPVEAPPSA